MIFFVEDDANIRELVIYTLKNSGFEAAGFALPSQFYDSLSKLEKQGQKPELILLDIMLPEEDGLKILKKLRENSWTEDIPIMMLTARDREYDKVLGLNNGADDYMPKPFGMMELVARVRALLRRNHTVHIDADVSMTVEEVRLYPNQRKVTVKGKEVELTYKEFELLRLLMENRGVAISRESLLSRIWGYSFAGESRTVDVHIRTLRHKLQDGGHIIETVRGIGYRVCGENNA